MRKRVLAALLLTVSSTASADSSDTPQPAASKTATYDLGVRIGGYGFRREPTNDTPLGVNNAPWDECRMNGLGIFGSRALTGPLFVEAGLDMYGSIGASQPNDLPLDRTSGLVTTAIGARTQIASWLRGYVQLGGGVELTRLSVPYGDQRIRDNKLLPEGFFGIGAELKLLKHTHFGANLRTHLMGNFDYNAERLDMSQGWAAPPSAGEVFDASPDVAAQGQFYIRHEL
jgi:hypothetical protein